MITKRKSTAKRRAVAGLLAASFLAGALPVVTPTVTASSTVAVDITTTAGADRYDTAAKIALATFSGPLDDIIVASGLNFPDALAGNALAGAVESPVLLTRPDRLPATTAAALEALAGEDTTVHILGGPGAVSEAVEAEILALFADDDDDENGDLETTSVSTNRVAGMDRYATSIAIAEFMDANLTIGTTFEGSRSAFITTGENFADAVAVGPLAYHGKSPVLLVPNLGPDSTQSDAELNLRVRAVLDAIEDLEIDSVIILGGTAAVSDGIRDAIAQRLGPDKILRIAGDNRFDTAAEIAEYAASQLGFNLQTVLIARAEFGNMAAFADALAGGPHGGEIKAPILLANPDVPVPAATLEWLEDNDNVIRTLRRLGGPAAISDAAMFAMRNAAQPSAPFELGDRTEAPELQFVRTVPGENNVLEYVFDEVVDGQTLARIDQGDGTFVYPQLRVYDTTCAGIVFGWIRALDPPVIQFTPSRTTPPAPGLTPPWEPLLDEDGNRVTEAVGGTTTRYLATEAAIGGNGNVIRARFPQTTLPNMSRAGVMWSTADSDTGRPNIEAGYPINPKTCIDTLVVPGNSLSELQYTTNWDFQETLLDQPTITVDFVFSNPTEGFTDVPTWLIGTPPALLPNDPVFPALWDDSEELAEQFWLVGNQSTVQRGSFISINGTGPVADGYQVRVVFTVDFYGMILESSLRRGFVRDQIGPAITTNLDNTCSVAAASGITLGYFPNPVFDGDECVDDEGQGVVQSGAYIQSSGVTVDPDLVTVVGPLTGPQFGQATVFNFTFDEAVSNNDIHINPELFGVYNREYTQLWIPNQVEWVQPVSSRTVRAFFLPGNVPVNPAGAFVEDCMLYTNAPNDTPCVGPEPGDLGAGGFGAVRGTDTLTGQNDGYNRPAGVPIAFDSGAVDITDTAILQAGYTTLPDLSTVRVTQDPINENWRATYNFDPRYGGNICSVDTYVNFDLFDQRGVITSVTIIPSEYVGANVQVAPRISCNPTANSITFDGGLNGAHNNDTIEAAVVGGVENGGGAYILDYLWNPGFEYTGTAEFPGVDFTCPPEPPAGPPGAPIDGFLANCFTLPVLDILPGWAAPPSEAVGSRFAPTEVEEGIVYILGGGLGVTEGSAIIYNDTRTDVGEPRFPAGAGVFTR